MSGRFLTTGFKGRVVARVAFPAELQSLVLNLQLGLEKDREVVIPKWITRQVILKPGTQMMVGMHHMGHLGVGNNLR